MKPALPKVRICPECEAENSALAERCWLCYRPLTEKADVILAEFVPDKPQRKTGVRSTTETVFATLTGAVLVLVLVMLIGAARDEPGLASLVAVAAVPAFLITLVTVAIRHSAGKKFSWRSTFIAFAGTLTGVLVAFVIAIVLAFLLMIAMIVAFFEACAKMLGGQ